MAGRDQMNGGRRPIEVRPTASSGFGTGFFGCFGVLAAVCLVIVLVVGCSIIGTINSSNAPRAPDPRLYAVNCEMGLAAAQRRFPQLANAHVAGAQDPEVLVADASQRIVCPLQWSGGYASITVDSVCLEFEDRCTRLVAVSAGSINWRMP